MLDWGILVPYSTYVLQGFWWTMSQALHATFVFGAWANWIGGFD